MVYIAGIMIAIEMLTLKTAYMEKRSGFDDWVDIDERAVEWGLRFACTK